MSSSRSGFMTLLAVILTSAIGVAGALALITFGTDSARTSLALVQSARSRAAAYGCAEYAMRAVRVSDFIGSTTTSLGGAGCGYAVQGEGGERYIQAFSDAYGMTHRLEIRAIPGEEFLELISWEEVGSF